MTPIHTVFDAGNKNPSNWPAVRRSISQIQSYYEEGSAYFLTQLGLQASKTWDPGSSATGVPVSTTITVTDSKLGDFVTASFEVTGGVPAGVALFGSVTADGTVTVTLVNFTTPAVDLASGTLRVLVRPHA